MKAHGSFDQLRGRTGPDLATLAEANPSSLIQKDLSMAFTAWLVSLFQARRRPIRKASRRRTPWNRVNLHLETLEDRLAPASVVTLASFATPSTGTAIYPNGGLAADGSGNLFGTTGDGGVDSFGTVFEVAHNSKTIITLASFTGSNC